MAAEFEPAGVDPRDYVVPWLEEGLATMLDHDRLLGIRAGSYIREAIDLMLHFDSLTEQHGANRASLDLRAVHQDGSTAAGWHIINRTAPEKFIPEADQPSGELPFRFLKVVPNEHLEPRLRIHIDQHYGGSFEAFMFNATYLGSRILRAEMNGWRFYYLNKAHDKTKISDPIVPFGLIWRDPGTQN